MIIAGQLPRSWNPVITALPEIRPWGSGTSGSASSYPSAARMVANTQPRSAPRAAHTLNPRPGTQAGQPGARERRQPRRAARSTNMPGTARNTARASPSRGISGYIERMMALRSTPRALGKVNTAADAERTATALPSPAWTHKFNRSTQPSAMPEDPRPAVDADQRHAQH